MLIFPSATASCWDHDRHHGWQQENGTNMIHNLYPSFRKKSFLHLMSSSSSTPFGENPSTTPRMPRPCSVSATTTSVGLAVAQKMRQTSGTIFSVFSTFSG